MKSIEGKYVIFKRSKYVSALCALHTFLLFFSWFMLSSSSSFLLLHLLHFVVVVLFCSLLFIWYFFLYTRMRILFLVRSSSEFVCLMNVRSICVCVCLPLIWLCWCWPFYFHVLPCCFFCIIFLFIPYISLSFFFLLFGLSSSPYPCLWLFLFLSCSFSCFVECHLFSLLFLVFLSLGSLSIVQHDFFFRSFFFFSPVLSFYQYALNIHGKSIEQLRMSVLSMCWIGVVSTNAKQNNQCRMEPKSLWIYFNKQALALPFLQILSSSSSSVNLLWIQNMFLCYNWNFASSL